MIIRLILSVCLSPVSDRAVYHFFFFLVKAPPMIRFTRLMLQVMSKGCATSHAKGIHPAPIETILGTLSNVDRPIGSPGMVGAAA